MNHEALSTNECAKQIMGAVKNMLERMDKYNQLKEQVKKELAWAKEAYEKEKSNPGKERYDRGMLFAYESILSTINYLDGEDFSES